MSVTTTTKEQSPKLDKKHTPEETKILKEYTRLSKREGLTQSQRITFLLLDSRTHLAFFINLSVYLAVHFCFATLRFDIPALIVGSLGADLLSGVVHIYLDHSQVVYDGTLWDMCRMGFQVHHLYPNFPWLMHPNYQPYLECNTVFPYVTGVTLFNALTFDISMVYYTCFCVLSFQATHYYAHARTHNKPIPGWIRRLQNTGIILHPDIHQKHHQTYDNNYCILNGSMNWLCDYFVADEKRLNEFVRVVDKSPLALVGVVVVMSVVVLVPYVAVFGRN